jgi:phage replication-related protein YjqB (UPF0714/DUF867 family)
MGGDATGPSEGRRHYRRGVTFVELLAHPDVVEDTRLASRVGFLALHGGVEPGTAEIARAAAEGAGASWYAVVQPATMKRHVPSHLIDPEGSGALRAFLAHVRLVVSIHGYFGRDDLERALLVGGADRERAARLALTLRAALPGYRVVDELDAIPPRLRGVDPRNPVNRAAGGGVQLELPHPVRSIGPYGRGDRRTEHRAHTRALVGALADFATGSYPLPA